MTLRGALRAGLRIVAGALALAVAGFLVIVFRTASNDCLPAARPGPILDANVVSGGVVYEVSRDLGPFFGDAVGRVRWRSGLLSEDAGLKARLAGQLQPLDVLVQKNGFALSDSFIPGYYTHAIIYLGTPAQLKAAGLWDLPALAAVQARLQAGNVFVEVDRTGSHLVPLPEVTNTDELVVMRIAPPADGGAGWQAEMVRRLVSSLNKPYDFAFDVDTVSETTCAELVLRTFTHVAWPLRDVMGRRALLPDDIVRTALSGQGAVRVMAFHSPAGSSAAPDAGAHLAQCTAAPGAAAAGTP